MDHKNILKMLFPCEVGGVFDSDVAIEGQYLDELQADIDALVGELFPDSALETLSDWERVYEIKPAEAATPVERRAAATQKKRARGGLSRAYFMSLAAALGYTISIEELPPNADGYGWESIWVWRVHVASGLKPVGYFTAGDSLAGDELASWPVDAVLEDSFNKLKPDHTQVFFVYE